MAERFELDVADISEALAYDDATPEEMRRAEVATTEPSKSRETARRSRPRRSNRMADRVRLDENVEREVGHRLDNDGHDVVHVDFEPELGTGAIDRSLAEYTITEDRVLVTDDDFVLTLHVDAFRAVRDLPDASPPSVTNYAIPVIANYRYSGGSNDWQYRELPGLQYPDLRWTFPAPSRIEYVSVTKPRIISGDDSEIHDEPHIQGSRITVQHVHARVEERGLRPDTVADRLNLDLADVYEALAYYHRNPEEMRDVEAHRQQVAHEADPLEKPE